MVNNMKGVSPFFTALILYGLVTCQSTDVASLSKKTVQQVEYEASDDTQGKNVSFECHNTTLGPKEYEIFPNGTLHSKTHNLMFNSSSYIKMDASVTVCSPDELSKAFSKRVSKSVYFAILGFLFQMPVPFAVGISVHCPRMRRTLLASVFFCLWMAYCGIPTEYSINNPALWKSLPSFLNFVTVTSFAWMNLLCSEVVVRYLKSLGHIAITKKNKIFVMRGRGVAQLSILLGTVIALLTFIVVYSGMIEDFTGLPRELDSLGNILPFFSPSVLILTLPLFLNTLSQSPPPLDVENGENDFWITLLQNNVGFFFLLLLTFFTWVLGCFIVISDSWCLWGLFSTLSGLFAIMLVTAEFLQNIFADKFAADIAARQPELPTIKIDNPHKSVTAIV